MERHVATWWTNTPAAALLDILGHVVKLVRDMSIGMLFNVDYIERQIIKCGSYCVGLYSID